MTVKYLSRFYNIIVFSFLEILNPIKSYPSMLKCFSMYFMLSLDVFPAPSAIHTYIFWILWFWHASRHPFSAHCHAALLIYFCYLTRNGKFSTMYDSQHWLDQKLPECKCKTCLQWWTASCLHAKSPLAISLSWSKSCCGVWSETLGQAAVYLSCFLSELSN